MLLQPAILKEPLPEVTVVKMLDNGVVLSLKPYSLAQNQVRVNSDVVEMAKLIFEKNDIALAPSKIIV